MLTTGALRIAPLQREMTLSFLERVADGYGLSVRSLLSAITDVAGQQNVVGVLKADSEVFLNAAARERVAGLCRLRQEDLRRALPAWEQEEPQGRYAEGPAARLHAGVETVAAWGAACPGCVAARTGRVASARLYLAAHQRVCPRHQYWLMAVPDSGGCAVGLARCPEVAQAQADHQRLLRLSPVGGEAFQVAEAVTAWWWAQDWPEERTWPARLRVTAPPGEEPGLWRVLGRCLVTYPETVTVAEVLADESVRRRIPAGSDGHPPFCLADAAGLVGELAHRLGRPWLADRLASCTYGPLFTWAHRCSTLSGQSRQDGQRMVWQVHSGHRPRPVADELAEYRQQTARGGATGAPAPKRRRGHSHQADEAFTAGLAHARAYAAAHGHLATRADTLQDGFLLGQWMSNQRMYSLDMPGWRSAALSALDPWWNTPWPTLWQRTYHQARRHVQGHGLLDARRGFPGTSINLGEWLYLQCSRYPDLHPEQQRLLTPLGIDAAAARAARPRRRNMRASEQEALAHARAWAAEHGGLAGVGTGTVHEGYPLGRWLAGRRSQMGRGVLSADRAEALVRIDPWWRPPWHLRWQRSYEHARQQLQAVGGGELTACFPRMNKAAREWLLVQQRRYRLLRPGQQDLLAEIGLTLEAIVAVAQADFNGGSGARVRAPLPDGRSIRPEAVADTRRRQQHPHEDDGQGSTEAARPRARSVTQQGPLGVARSRLGQRPDHRARFERALVQARAWAAIHGHLAVPREVQQDGFALGMWLFSQRNRAKQRARQGEPPSPHLEELAAIDPWWNPPWDLHWQRNYYRARDHMGAGRRADAAGGLPVGKDALGIWVKRQCTLYDTLHPDQQRLLAAIGITAEAARARIGPRTSWRLTTTARFDTDVTHAHAYAAQYGHLAAHSREEHEGFPIGRWLAEHRERARRRGGTSPQGRVLASLDPWWNPPWPMRWQYAYHHARTHPDTARAEKWIAAQHQGWSLLHPAQQQLLAGIGISPDSRVPTARGYTAARNPSTGLACAHAYHQVHGHLAVPHDHVTEDGFPLGAWLKDQRGKARTGRASKTAALAVIDPWWNPPWSLTWHRSLHHFQAATAAEETLTPTLRRWAHRQRANWHRLHPHQQHLLTSAGIPPDLLEGRSAAHSSAVRARRRG